MAKSKKKYTVKVRFADKDDFSKKYEPGTDVSDFDNERLKKLVERGIVEKVSDDQ